MLKTTNLTLGAMRVLKLSIDSLSLERDVFATSHQPGGGS